MIIYRSYYQAAFLLGCCFFVINIHAQEPELFWRYGAMSGSTEGLDFIDVIDNEIIAIGWTHDYIGAKGEGTFNRLKFDGNVLHNTIFQFDTALIQYGANGSGFIHQNKIIIGGSGNEIGNVSNPVIYSYDFNGNATILKVLTKDSSCGFNQGKLTPKGDYIFIGQTTEFDPYGDYFLVKTDANGNVLWEQTYGTPYFDNALSVDITADGGYIIHGSSTGYGSVIGVYSDGLLIKTDKDGNEEWRTTWGEYYSDCNWNVEATADSGFVVCGCIAKESKSALEGYVRKMDKNGSLVWEHTFPQNDGGYPYIFGMCHELDNGWTVAAGAGWIWFNDSNNHEAPWAVIFDENGEILMNRHYASIFPENSNSRARFTDFRITEDGGFIGGGTYFPGVGDTGNQDMFILKLDSNGCEYPNCQPPLGVETDPVLEESEFSAYPNPFSEVITFQFGLNSKGILLITDLSGRVMATLNIAKGEQSLLWQTSGLSPGVYFSTLVNENGPQQTLKIIKY